MKIKRKIIKLLSTAFIISMMGSMLTGCSSSTADTSNILNFGCTNFSDSLDPAAMPNAAWCVSRYGIGEALFRFDDQMEADYYLCDDYSVNDDNTEWTFHIRDGVKFSNGKELTASAVVESIEYMYKQEKSGKGSSTPSVYMKYDSIKADDESRTVTIKTSKPHTDLTKTLAHPYFSILDMESDLVNKPVGTGPYKFVSWDAGQTITMEKNEEYFAGAANIDTIVFKIVTDDNAKAMQLLSGELDLAQITPKEESLFADNDEFKVYDMTTSDYRGILYNFNNEYWQENADLIPAINYAIDRKAILDAVLLDKGEVAYGPLQRNKYNNENVEHYDYNLEKSAEIFEAAGCTKDADGYWCRNGERISFTINATPGDQVRIDMAQIAAQQLREAGLDVKADVPAGGIDWAGQECCIIGWGSPFDADDHTYKVFGTDKGANYSGYSNALVDEYLTQARQTEDENERKEAYAKFQEALAETPAYTFFCYIDALYAAENTIQGIDEDTVLGHHGVGIFWNICDWTIENQ